MVKYMWGAAALGGTPIVCYGAYSLHYKTRGPSFKTIADSSSKESYVGKFGEDFKHHFVDADSQENKDWWERSLKDRVQNQASLAAFGDEFKEIKEPFGDSTHHLSKVCKDAYGKETKKDFFPETDENNSKEIYRQGIWKLCSFYGEMPTSLLLYEGQGEGTWGKHLQSKLIDVRNPGNSLFWKAHQKKFKEGNLEPDNFFTKKLKVGKEIKDICGEVYFLKKDDNSASEPKPTEQDILRYCSLKGTN